MEDRDSDEMALLKQRTFSSSSSEQSSYLTASPEAAELTSVYEEEQNVPYGSSLFYFLVHSGYSSILPFLTIFLNKHGFSFSQIGVINGLSFLISSVFGFLWFYVTQKYDSKKDIMLVSTASWVIFIMPLFYFPFYEVNDQCSRNDLVGSTEVVKNTTNLNVIDPNNNLMTSNSWEVMDYPFLIVIALFISGRMIQAATDYFYFNHKCLLYVETSREDETSKKVLNYRLLTKAAGVFISIFIGHVLDSTSYCDESFGHFKITFYVFCMFLFLAGLILYFLDNVPHTPSYMPNTVKCMNNVNGEPVCSVHNTIIFICLFCLAASKGIFITFLYPCMVAVDSLYLQIGVAYAVYKISEALYESLTKMILKQFGMFEVVFINLCSGAIKNLYYGYVSSRYLAWFIIPLEVLSGLSIILHISTELYLRTTSSAISRNASYKVFYTIWCLGYSFGPIIFGFMCDGWSIIYSFRVVSLIHLLLSIILLFSHTIGKDKERELGILRRNEKYESDSEEEIAEFLNRKSDHEHEEDNYNFTYAMEK